MKGVDGTVRSWGMNFKGQLGDGTTSVGVNTPVPVSGLSGVTALGAGGAHSLALLSNGTVYSWGSNDTAALGDNTVSETDTPIQVKDPGDDSGFLTAVMAIAVGDLYNLVLLTDGTMRGWGFNALGTLGDGTNIERSFPVPVIDPYDTSGLLTGVVVMGSGLYHGLASVAAVETAPPEVATKIYWTNFVTKKIQRADAVGIVVQDLVVDDVDNPLIPFGIALDQAGGKIYWANTLGKIQRANLDGTAVENLVEEQNGPIDVALDLEAGKLYWSDAGPDRGIFKANLDGGGPIETIIAAGGGLQTRAFALDSQGGEIYWISVDGSPTGYIIKRTNLDGTGLVEDLILAGSAAPIDIALDTTASKMYWTNNNTGTVQRANLDGTSLETLVDQPSTSPRGIALDLGSAKIYWAGDVNQNIQRANLEGSDVEEVVTGVFGFGIALEFGPPPPPDTTPPTVTIDQQLTQADPTSDSPINFTVEFSEDVIGFDGTDILLTGAASATTAVVTGGPTTYNVAVSGMTASGPVIASVLPGAATDGAGNQSLVSTSVDNEVTFDSNQPPVADAGADQPAVEGTVIGGAGVPLDGTSSFDPDPGDTISFLWTAGDGISFDDPTSATPTATVPFGGPHTMTLTVTDGALETDFDSVDVTVVDTTPPTVTLEQSGPPQRDPTNIFPINFTVQFSENVTGFGVEPTDVILGGTAGPSTVVVTGGPATYNLAVSGMTNDGTVTASVPAVAAIDGAENPNQTSTSVDNQVTYDTTPPTLNLPDDITVIAGSPVFFTVSATENFGPIDCNRTSGFEAISDSTVTCSAVDEAGNTTFGSFNVTVLIPFAITTIKEAEVELEAQPLADEAEVGGTFLLGPNNIVDVANQDVTITFGELTVTIPAGSFVRDDDNNGFVIEGLPGIDEVKIWDDGSFEVEWEDLDLLLASFDDPVDFTLQIGANIGLFSIQLDPGGELHAEDNEGPDIDDEDVDDIDEGEIDNQEEDEDAEQNGIGDDDEDVDDQDDNQGGSSDDEDDNQGGNSDDEDDNQSASSSDDEDDNQSASSSDDEDDNQSASSSDEDQNDGSNSGIDSTDEEDDDGNQSANPNGGEDEDDNQNANSTGDGDDDDNQNANSSDDEDEEDISSANDPDNVIEDDTNNSGDNNDSDGDNSGTSSSYDGQEGDGESGDDSDSDGDEDEEDEDEEDEADD